MDMGEREDGDVAKIAKVNMSLYVSRETRWVIEQYAKRLEVPMSVVVEMMIGHYTKGVPIPIIASEPRGATGEEPSDAQ